MSSYHVSPLPRESAVIKILRHKGYRIHEIASFLGRSTSFVWKRLRLGLNTYTEHFDDKRKIPNKVRQFWSRKRCQKLEEYRKDLERFMLGLSDKPH